MKVVILAGGKGARLGDITKNIPKPMIHLAGKPILEHQIELGKRYGFSEFIILTGYKSKIIKDYFYDGSSWDVNIQYREENVPLGTSGAVKEIEDILSEDFLVFYGDMVMDIDLNSFVTYHSSLKPTATVFVHPNDHPYDSDIVAVDNNGRVVAFHSKPHKKGVYYRNLTNAALYILSPSILKYIERGRYSDFGKDIFPKMVSVGESIYAYNSPEYIKDVGTKERLEEVENDFLSGRIKRFNKKLKRNVVFLDRDGVLNVEVDNLSNPEELKLLPNTEKAIRKLNKSDYLTVVVTNQSVIAKGLASEKDVDDIHAKLESLLGEKNAYINRIYYCPHHPERGFLGERKEYKIKCDCRKPKTGMLEKATKELNIELNDSFMIGDRTVDIFTGIKAGLKTILVKTGYSGEDGKYQCEPDFIFEDLKEAVDFIVDSQN